jgi:hypothetical protein
MKRRMKKILINQPTGLENIELDDLDESDNGEWDTKITGARSRHFQGLRRKDHDNVSALHFRHSHKHSGGKGFFG